LPSTFKIYRASAGSGKTYTLAKAYIKLLISSKNPEHFRHILAITFTNKAVEEMKSRVIEKLKLFSSTKKKKDDDSMFNDICRELQITSQQLQSKCHLVLQKIIHNYGAFEISTIDGFVHRVIRTFAFDLKLPVNFEVELDQDYLLNKAVDALISKAGQDKNLTKTLIDFAIEKADDDKSWDISRDIFNTGKLLLSENDLPHINSLMEKHIGDFDALKNHLKASIAKLENTLVSEANAVLTLINEAGLEHSDFSGNYLIKYFIKLSNNDFKVEFGRVWQTRLTEDGLLTRSKELQHIADTVKAIQPQIAEAFLKTKAWIFELKLNAAIYKNITPLSVLNALKKELENLKSDENKILISEFNALISNEIKEQPTPFIYERLGEKFRHYFIDEFQDTSVMQWQNLIPLVDNTLSSSYGSVMLVGDAKQSIYRWRGGDTQQFIDLFTHVRDPFVHTKAEIENLDHNYRSAKDIVKFNNSFFKFLAENFFSNNDYSALYKNAYQKITHENHGYVDLSFLEYKTADEGSEKYCIQTFEKITECLNNNYSLNDICILVRRRKDGIAISNFLTQQGIEIMSSETLLLKNSPKVKLLNAVLNFLNNPKERRLKLNMLNEISSVLNIEDRHTFYNTYLELSAPEVFDSLRAYNILLSYQNLIQSSIYETAENLVRTFNLCSPNSDAYVEHYLDTVLEYSLKEASDISGFLDYFESKQEKLSISVPQNANAVSVMTIHKSKGLEFPVVIFPFADLDIYDDKKGKVWFPIEAEKYSGFKTAMINYKSEISEYGTYGKHIHEKHKSQLELDAANLIYVTLTRAIEKLYIISKSNINENALKEQKNFASLFINYLKSINQWKDRQKSYVFGKNDAKLTDSNKAITSTDYEFITNPKQKHRLNVITKNGQLWETKQQNAINYGNLLHLVMANIETMQDVNEAVNGIALSQNMNDKDANDFKQKICDIVENTSVSKYYTDAYTVYNEKEIINDHGEFLRPDRIAIKNNNVTIIDYKTGAEDVKHKVQLDLYASALEQMDFNVEKKLLIYTNEDLKIVEVM